MLLTSLKMILATVLLLSSCPTPASTAKKHTKKVIQAGRDGINTIEDTSQ